LVPEGDRHGDGEPESGAARRHLDGRLDSIERLIEDLRRRQVVAELRSDPSRLLAGVADIRRVARQDIDDLSELLARWDVPLSSAEEEELRHADLLAQAVSGARHSTVLIVVDVAARVSADSLTRVAGAAGILSGRSRRALPVLVVLGSPTLDESEAAASLGVELVVDV
jgi:hypothetical protein